MLSQIKHGFLADLRGRINGQAIQLSGSGKIVHENGVVHGTYILRKIPVPFDPAILSACLLTGYPNICATRNGVRNPFGNHPYEYTRQLSFRSGGELMLKTSCKHRGNMLISRFELEGHLDTPKLVAVEPITETWEANGRGAICGAFVVAWRTESGALFVADARSEYRILGTEDNQKKLFHRLINVHPTCDGIEFSLHQQSELID
jgi:hypothetical protein